MADAHLHWGILYLVRGDHRRARRFLRRSLAVQPSPAAVVLLASSWLPHRSAPLCLEGREATPEPAWQERARREGGAVTATTGRRAGAAAFAVSVAINALVVAKYAPRAGVPSCAGAAAYAGAVRPGGGMDGPRVSSASASPAHAAGGARRGRHPPHAGRRARCPAGDAARRPLVGDDRVQQRPARRAVPVSRADAPGEPVVGTPGGVSGRPPVPMARRRRLLAGRRLRRLRLRVRPIVRAGLRRGRPSRAAGRVAGFPLGGSGAQRSAEQRAPRRHVPHVVRAVASPQERVADAHPRNLAGPAGVHEDRAARAAVGLLRELLPPSRSGQRR